MANDKAKQKLLRITKDNCNRINRSHFNGKMKLQNSCKVPELPSTENELFDLNENVLFEDALEMTKCKYLSETIEDRLREAKSFLKCGEVLLPCNLTLKIANHCLKMSENEPCGIRGCVLYINLEEKNACTRLGKVACSPDTVSTFEVILNLRQDCSKWLSLRRLLPAKLLEKFGRKRTLVISNCYTLRKKKLYRSNSS